MCVHRRRFCQIVASETQAGEDVVTYFDVRFCSLYRVFTGLHRDLAERGVIAVRRGRGTAQISLFLVQKN